MMTLKQGRVLGRELRLTGEGAEDRPSYPGGRIITPDPAAVANFMRMMREEQAARPAAPQQKKAGIRRARNGRLDADLQRKVDELKARAVRPGVQKECDEMARLSKLTDEDVLAAHRRYALLNMSLKDAAASVSRSVTPLRKAFAAQDLPCRQHGTGVWLPEDLERVCEVHQVTIADLPVESVDWDAQAGAEVFAREHPDAELVMPAEPKPQPASKRLEPTVIWRNGAPVPNGEQTAVLPAPPSMPANGHVAPAANGHTADDEPLDIGEQLALLSDLLAQANAQSVKLTGRLSIELRAEVVF